jgi:hypothetical protein
VAFICLLFISFPADTFGDAAVFIGFIHCDASVGGSHLSRLSGYFS